MSRRHRLRIVGVSQHVTQRGNNRSDIFRAIEDYEAFQLIVALALRRHPLDLHGYVLMRNHVHLLVTPRSPSALSLAMQLVGVHYVRYFNQRYGRTGGLYEGRYRATIIDTDVYWYRCLRYIEANPVRAKIVSRVDAYQWSSYAANGLGLPDRLITPHPLYQALGTIAAERQSQWRAFCAVKDSEEDLELLRKAFHSGGVLGRLVVPDGVRPR